MLSDLFKIDKNRGVKNTSTLEKKQFFLNDFKPNPYPFADWIKCIRLISLINKGKYLNPTPKAMAILAGIFKKDIEATSFMILMSETSSIEMLMIENSFKKSGTMHPL